MEDEYSLASDQESCGEKHRWTPCSCPLVFIFAFLPTKTRLIDGGNNQWAAEVVDGLRPVTNPTARPAVAPAKTEISTSTNRFSSQDFFLNTLIYPCLFEK